MSGPVEAGLTIDDLDEHPPEGVIQEVIGGELFVRGAGKLRHQSVSGRVYRRFAEYTDDHGGQAFPDPGLVFSIRDGVRPDVALVDAEAVARLGVEHLEEASLLVEVSSPGTRGVDLVRKRALYEANGVPEYWFVDLDADQIQVFRLDADGRYGPPEIVGRGGRIAPPHLPGLGVDVNDLLGQPES